MKRFLTFIVILSLAVATMTFASTFGWKGRRSVRHQDNSVLFEYLRNIVRILSKDIGHRDYRHPVELAKARDFIRKQFEVSGYQVSEQVYTTDELPGFEFSNLTALRSTPSGRPQIIVGAHYDSCDNPGADDNASGVAGLLAIARLLKDHPAVENIMFVAFVNEEPPFFATEEMGSRHYVRHLKEQNLDVRGAVILEMIGYFSSRPFSQRYPPGIGFGYPHTADFLAVVANRASGDFAEHFFDHLTDKTFPFELFISPSENIPGIYYSDHWSFWQEGYPALMVTDTAFLRTPHYHQSSDTWETLDYKRMAQAVLDLAEGVKGLTVHFSDIQTKP